MATPNIDRVRKLIARHANLKARSPAPLEISVSGAITIGMGSSIANKIRVATARGCRDIRVRIDSQGGNVSGAMKIVAAIESAKRRGAWITAHIDGQCASAAVCIAAVANVRSATPQSEFLLHRASYPASGGERPEFLRKIAGRLDEVDRDLERNLIDRLSLSAAQALAFHEGRDVCLDAREAIVAGLIHYEDGGRLRRR